MSSVFMSAGGRRCRGGRDWSACPPRAPSPNRGKIARDVEWSRCFAGVLPSTWIFRGLPAEKRNRNAWRWTSTQSCSWKQLAAPSSRSMDSATGICKLSLFPCRQVPARRPAPFGMGQPEASTASCSRSDHESHRHTALSTHNCRSQNHHRHPDGAPIYGPATDSSGGMKFFARGNESTG